MKMIAGKTNLSRSRAATAASPLAAWLQPSPKARTPTAKIPPALPIRRVRADCCASKLSCARAGELPDGFGACRRRISAVAGVVSGAPVVTEGIYLALGVEWQRGRFGEEARRGEWRRGRFGGRSARRRMAERNLGEEARGGEWRKGIWGKKRALLWR
ncbi:hypothetical protein SEVIR_9G488101v4 [Setaria viridis]